MQDKDLTNLPILDDIIIPGDAGKAANDRNSTNQDAIRETGEDGTIDLSGSDITARIDSEIPDGSHVIVGDDRSDGLPDPAVAAKQLDSADFAIDMATPPAPAARAAVRGADIDQPMGAAGRQTEIDNLTEQVMARMMPDLEKLMREKIRQTLQQHLPEEKDRD